MINVNIFFGFSANRWPNTDFCQPKTICTPKETSLKRSAQLVQPFLWSYETNRYQLDILTSYCFRLRIRKKRLNYNCIISEFQLSAEFYILLEMSAQQQLSTAEVFFSNIILYTNPGSIQYGFPLFLCFNGRFCLILLYHYGTNKKEIAVRQGTDIQTYILLQLYANVTFK